MILSCCVNFQNKATLKAQNHSAVLKLNPHLILGLKWDHQRDTLVVSRGMNFDAPAKVTQRIVLSTVAKVFDSLGLFVPFTVGAPLFLKEIWRCQGQQGDDALPQAPLDQFLKWTADLTKNGALIVPRAYFTDRSEALELHVFGDGSLEVFSSLAFLRSNIRNSTAAEIAFVIGKARFAPMKVMAVPKLELQGALLASRLACEVKKGLAGPPFWNSLVDRQHNCATLVAVQG